MIESIVVENDSLPEEEDYINKYADDSQIKNVEEHKGTGEIKSSNKNCKVSLSTQVSTTGLEASKEVNISTKDNEKTIVNQEYLSEFTNAEGNICTFDDATSTNFTSDMAPFDQVIHEDPIENITDTVIESSKISRNQNSHKSNKGKEVEPLKEASTSIIRKKISDSEYAFFIFEENESPDHAYFTCSEFFASAFRNDSALIFPISFVFEGVLFEDDYKKRFMILKAFKRCVRSRDKAE
ncbi:hypothetical protein SteCoe_34650 [Stentor coeruleus]|uniref:Uncharacterized protein n=1 Tax=Stentor coeruleus TaxID=5963 RepID=A0A1R2AU32_9CILI|nr:hypothetical protein SteCoe_34650 [Stentor coeruleus]